MISPRGMTRNPSVTRDFRNASHRRDRVAGAVWTYPRPLAVTAGRTVNACPAGTIVPIASTLASVETIPRNRRKYTGAQSRGAPGGRTPRKIWSDRVPCLRHRRPIPPSPNSTGFEYSLLAFAIELTWTLSSTSASSASTSPASRTMPTMPTFVAASPYPPDTHSAPAGFSAVVREPRGCRDPGTVIVRRPCCAEAIAGEGSLGARVASPDAVWRSPPAGRACRRSPAPQAHPRRRRHHWTGSQNVRRAGHPRGSRCRRDTRFRAPGSRLPRRAVRVSRSWTAVRKGRSSIEVVYLKFTSRPATNPRAARCGEDVLAGSATS